MATGSRWRWPRAAPSAARWTGCTKPCWAAEVAQALGYKLGQRITLTHGWAQADIGGALAAEHADKPFTVVGVLARTGTPVDRTVHVSLQAIEAIHLDWVGGAPLPARRV
jgi:putative ABC transport system permease protein